MNARVKISEGIGWHASWLAGNEVAEGVVKLLALKQGAVVVRGVYVIDSDDRTFGSEFKSLQAVRVGGYCEASLLRGTR